MESTLKGLTTNPNSKKIFKNFPTLISYFMDKISIKAFLIFSKITKDVLSFSLKSTSNPDKNLFYKIKIKMWSPNQTLQIFIKLFLKASPETFLPNQIYSVTEEYFHLLNKQNLMNQKISKNKLLFLIKSWKKQFKKNLSLICLKIY